MYTPSSRHARTLSPPLSTAGSSTTLNAQPKLNVVTRLAIEGRAKQGQDGAAIKIYLKLSIPMDSVAPGSTLPLFPEENLKILSAQVHPLDPASVPYNFSSTAHPLLNAAARALNLPARSHRSYLSVFGLARTPVETALEDRYTGHILVSGYNVSYVLPREFPPRFAPDTNGTGTAAKPRRGSLGGERNNMHFMAAIDLWVPLLSRPPRSPYLLSLPIPRCLSNTINLRIFPPSPPARRYSTSSSFASLSSAGGDDDPPAWELTSDPHVTRTAAPRARAGSYADMADDESSDSAGDACALQGTFPSAARVRVRWAAPVRGVSEGRGGRQRVGVREVKGEMTCLVLGRGCAPAPAIPHQSQTQATPPREGVLMRVEYRGTCRGVWFPGVATMLGLDVGLEAEGCDVFWAEDVDADGNAIANANINANANGNANAYISANGNANASGKAKAGWSVSGGPGFMGSDADAPVPPPVQSSALELELAFPQVDVSPMQSTMPSPFPSPSPSPSPMQSTAPSPLHSTTPSPTSAFLAPAMASRTNSTSSTSSLPTTAASSTASLLRAPLPGAHPPEYSFEACPGMGQALTPASTLSSIGSSVLSSDGGGG
ncbi:hypothetical protein BV22DRAFT_1092724, partial [Leucogyrophana mollusca]